MKKFRILFSCLFMTLIIFGCDREELIVLENQDDFLIFGTYASECAGNCTQFYKLTKTELFEDDTDYQWDELIFKPSPLENEKFIQASELFNGFPNSLLDSDQTVYGCPDCHDQGGVGISLKRGGDLRTWNLDPTDKEQNEEIIEYRKRISEMVALLK